MHIKYLYDKKTGLFYHGWTFEWNYNFGEIFWCRGNSWFTLGILEYIEMFKGSLNPAVKTVILDAYKAQAAALKELQSENGLWHTILDDPYRECAERGLRGILDNIAEDGTVLNVSAGTGIGMNAEHYKNIMILPMAYGQSLTIMALAEALLYE